MADDLLFDIAEALLDAVVAGYGADPELPPLPDRRYIEAGEVALDAGPGSTCDGQLVVTFAPPDQAAIVPGFPGVGETDPSINCERVTSAIYEVWLTRCVTVGTGKTPPSPEKLTEEAHVTMLDVRNLWLILFATYRNGGLPGGTCRIVRFPESRVLGSEGGTKTAIQPIEIALV